MLNQKSLEPTGCGEKGEKKKSKVTTRFLVWATKGIVVSESIRHRGAGLGKELSFEQTECELPASHSSRDV